MNNKIGIILNGGKSKKKVDNYIRLLQQQASYDINVFVTKNVNDIAHKTNMAIETGCNIIVSAGGDGTLLYIVNVLIDHPQIFLLTLPLGTGNDFSRMLGIRTIADAVMATQKCNIRKADIIESRFYNFCGEREKWYFCSSAGMGIFANVFRQEKSKIIQIFRKIFGNIMNYVCTIISIFTTIGANCDIAFGQEQHSLSLKLLEVNKIRVCGGTVLTPYAQIDNGIFDIWTIGNINTFRLLKIVLRTIFGKHLQDANVEYFCGKETTNRFGLKNLNDISLKISGQIPFHLHGEFIGYNPEYFKIISHKLNFLSNTINNE